MPLGVACPSTVVMTGLPAVGVGVGTTILDCTTVGAVIAAGVTPASLWGTGDDRSTSWVGSVPKAAKKGSSPLQAAKKASSSSLRLASVPGVLRASIVAAAEWGVKSRCFVGRLSTICTASESLLKTSEKIQTSGSPMWQVDGTALERRRSGEVKRR